LIQAKAPGSAGDIALGNPAAMRAWWLVALGSSLLVVAWLFLAGATWAALAAFAAGACLLSLYLRLLATSKLGTLHLLSDGSWVARKNNTETRLKLVAAAPWPGIVLLNYSAGGVRYPAAISPYSAGPVAYRQLLVRLRNAGPENRT
jgi:hypothetical protein